MPESTPFQMMYEVITDQAITGRYDQRMRLKSKVQYYGSGFINFVLADEGGRTRSVTDNKGDRHDLTYVARLDIFKEAYYREIWLLNTGNVWLWDGNECSYVDPNILGLVLEEITQ